jgi:hypothetical protein
MDKKLVDQARRSKNRLVCFAEAGIIPREERLRRRRIALRAQQRFTRRINEFYRPSIEEMISPL